MSQDKVQLVTPASRPDAFTEKYAITIERIFEGLALTYSLGHVSGRLPHQVGDHLSADIRQDFGVLRCVAGLIDVEVDDLIGEIKLLT
ncbi:hypothetical protein [Pseudomonas sp. GM49]|uniref:hypothetical protein n=1 Tax=Pseudomonas sp. GM49 TaxID=1144331 RepID=UPI0012FCD47A|nr:hypothetical protein [Pseudomonas sp. GM49]